MPFYVKPEEVEMRATADTLKTMDQRVAYPSLFFDGDEFFVHPVAAEQYNLAWESYFHSRNKQLMAVRESRWVVVVFAPDSISKEGLPKYANPLNVYADAYLGFANITYDDVFPGDQHVIIEQVMRRKGAPAPHVGIAIMNTVVRCLQQNRIHQARLAADPKKTVGKGRPLTSFYEQFGFEVYQPGT